MHSYYMPPDKSTFLYTVQSMYFLLVFVHIYVALVFMHIYIFQFQLPLIFSIFSKTIPLTTYILWLKSQKKRKRINYVKIYRKKIQMDFSAYAYWLYCTLLLNILQWVCMKRNAVFHFVVCWLHLVCNHTYYFVCITNTNIHAIYNMLLLLFLPLTLQ